MIDNNESKEMKEISNNENDYNDFKDPEKLKFYESLRNKLTSSVRKYSGERGEKFTGYILALPDFFILLCRLAVDKRVTRTQKAFIGAIIAYLILPLDFIPDFIPIIGYVDDLVLVVFGLNMILNELDKSILMENWSGEEDLISLLAKITGTAEQFLDHKILSKIKHWINKRYSKQA